MPDVLAAAYGSLSMFAFSHGTPVDRAPVVDTSSSAPKPIPVFAGFRSSVDERYQFAKDNRLFRLGVKVNTPDMCNWACPYCYVGAQKFADRPRSEKLTDSGELSPFKDPDWARKMKGWIEQGIAAGAKAVSINGTFEPTTAPGYLEIIRFCTQNDMSVTLVTNGSMLTPEAIQELYQLGTGVVTKLNVPFVEADDPRYQDFCAIQKRLSGRPAEPVVIYEEQKALIRQLIDAGFNRPTEHGETRLGVESVVTTLNVDHLPQLIAQLREWNIYSHIEVAKIQGFAKNNADLTLTKERLWTFFFEVQEQDKATGYAEWTPKPPYVAGTCYENLFRVDLHADGKVKPCPGIETLLGNLNTTPLAEIMENKNLAIIRDLQNTIQGDCKSCELMKTRQCYGGCRGTVYQTMKANNFSEYDCITASDPSCIRVNTVLNDGTPADIFDVTRRDMGSPGHPIVSPAKPGSDRASQHTVTA
jgi:radical SAM protein with 4Fe4S-binding SPASM domain